MSVQSIANQEYLANQTESRADDLRPDTTPTNVELSETTLRKFIDLQKTDFQPQDVHIAKLELFRAALKQGNGFMFLDTFKRMEKYFAYLSTKSDFKISVAEEVLNPLSLNPIVELNIKLGNYTPADNGWEDEHLMGYKNGVAHKYIFLEAPKATLRAESIKNMTDKYL